MLLRHIHGNDAIVRIYKTTVVDDVQHDKVVQDLSKYYDIKYISAAFPGTDLVGLEKGLDHLQDEEMETDIEALLDEKRSEEIPDVPIKENVLSGMESMGGEYRPE